MTEEFSLVKIREGSTELIVPEDHASNGPSSANMPVFYNPKMEFNRDMSVAVLGRLLSDGDSLLDGMAATGARGIRVKKETGKDIKLYLNDENPRAVELIKRNLEANAIPDADVTQLDLRSLLLEGSYDCVDIDPFGSPAPFFPMGVGAVRNDGILCVTATDTGTISGIFPSACLRKYGCEGRRTPFCHEFGVRNLLGFISREAARQDAGIRPLVSYYADHYIRTFVRVSKGARKADESLSRLGYCVFDSASLERGYQKDRENKVLGPIWIGSTCDPAFLEDMRLPSELRFANRIAATIGLLRGETTINRPHFVIDELASRFKIDPPKMEDFIAMLQKEGTGIRTHYGPKTFMTDANVEELVDAMRSS